MIQVPEAPLPPPPFQHHPGPQHLPADMERLNLDHGVPPFGGHNGPHSPPLERRFTEPSHQFDTALPFDGKGKVPVTLEGWSFTKQPAVRPDQKETWALAVKSQMPLSQIDLREQVTKQKRKGKSAADVLASQEMNGFKRKQVDRLILDRTRTDPDPRFEYKLAALRLGQETKRQGRQTVSMYVILRRQLRNGVVQGSAGYDRAQELDGEIVDLTGAEETNASQDSSSIGAHGHHAHMPPHGYHYQQPFVEFQGPEFEKRPRFEAQPPPHHGSPPVHQVHEPQMPQMPHPDIQGMPYEGFYPPHGDKEVKEKKKDKHGHDSKKDKVKIHQKDKKHKSYSDSSSDSFSDADSFDSKPFTDRTPDTVYSGGSSHGYHKEKRKSSGHKENRRDSHSSHDRHRSPTRQVYRERRRKSPIPASRKGSTKYDYEEYDVITSERRKPEQPYHHERPSMNRHPMSYEDDRPRRPTYRLERKLQSSPFPVELHAEKEALKWEIEEIKREKLRDKMEQERAERVRLELRRLEKEKLEMELERERQERYDRAERDRLDRINRERYERERLDRERMERDRLERDRFDRDRYDHVDRDGYNRAPYTEPPRRYPMPYEARRDDRHYGY